MLQSNRTGRAAAAVAEIERSRLATVYLAGMFLIVLVAAGGLLMLAHERNVWFADRRATEAVVQHRTANIVLNEGTKDCQLKSFDNTTGRISDAHKPCPDETTSDIGRNPAPQGTLHTMDAISKSFRSH